jgi:hypothetical protein
LRSFYWWLADSMASAGPLTLSETAFALDATWLLFRPN